jgi:hypothetical protein
MDYVYRRSYISMLFLYMTGMLTTPYEIRNKYAQEYSASSVRSVSVLDGLRRLSFVWVLWLFHARSRSFESFERKCGTERSEDVVSVLCEGADGSGSDTVIIIIGFIRE